MQCVSEIYDVCELDEDGHFIYKGVGSDVKHVTNKCFQGTHYSMVRLLFSFEYAIPLKDINHLQKLCIADLCIEPSHFCQRKDFENGKKDANGFTEAKRKMIHFRLGLLPNPYDDKECVYFPRFKDRNGYGIITLGKKTIGAHILALRVKIGRPLKAEMQASHICNHPSCINPFHLIEESQSQNVQRQAQCKLSNEDVIKIYEQKGKMMQKDIAKNFGVSTTFISRIHRGAARSETTKHNTPKKNKRNFEITQNMRDKLKKYLENKCDKIFDENIQDYHVIPKCAPKVIAEDAYYVRLKKWTYSTAFHILAAVIKFNLDRFPDPKKNQYVLHSCKRKDCCNYDHISIGTAKQNMADKKRDGTDKRGAKITQEIADMIRKENASAIQVAKKFKVTKAIVDFVRNGTHWVDSSSIEPPKKKPRLK